MSALHSSSEIPAAFTTAVQRNDRTQLREERAEPFRGCRLRPERSQELVAGHGPMPVHCEIGEREPSLAAGERALHASAVDPRDEPAAKLDPRLRQGFDKVTPSGLRDHSGHVQTPDPDHARPRGSDSGGSRLPRRCTAADAGHDVSLFLAGDAVQLLREPVLDSLVGLGTGSLRDSYDAIVEQGGRFYVSGMSSKARGFEPNGQAEAAMPDRLVELVLEADRVLTY